MTPSGGQIYNQFKWWHNGPRQLSYLKWIQILFGQQDNSRLNTLGPLCLWQCLAVDPTLVLKTEGRSFELAKLRGWRTSQIFEDFLEHFFSYLAHPYAPTIANTVYINHHMTMSDPTYHMLMKRGHLGRVIR